MPYQVSMMGWVAWRLLWVGLGWVLKSDPWPTLVQFGAVWLSQIRSHER